MNKIITPVVATLIALLAPRAEARGIQIQLYDWNADLSVVAGGAYNSIAWGSLPVRYTQGRQVQWVLEPVGNGWFVVRNHFAGRLLTVDSANATVVTHPRFEGPGLRWEQLWRIDDKRLRNAGGSCLKTVYANGTQSLGLGSCGITGTATWSFSPS